MISVPVDCRARLWTAAMLLVMPLLSMGCGSDGFVGNDETPPTMPLGVAAAAVSSSQINLSWTASTDEVGVAGYYVYRENGRVADVTETGFNDTGLSPSTTYSYEVAAYDGAGNTSDRSASVNATTRDPGSDVIADISFHFSTHRRLAPGSDNWPLTWADDGHQYTNWGDGGGFGGTNSDGRVSLGVGRVEGPRGAYTGHNVNGGYEAENPATLSGKSRTMFFIDGTLYMLASRGSFDDDCGGTICAYERQQLLRSTDYGATWGEVPGVVWLYDAGETIGFHHFINMGQAYADAMDEFVYVSAVEIQDPTATQIQAPGELILMRVPATPASIEDKTRYEYFSGTPDNPAWSSSFADRAPILSDADGFMRHSITYIPSLDRFLMLGPHTADDGGNLKVWESPAPWGPWHLVREWREDNGSGWTVPGEVMEWFFWDVSPKWISADGLNIVVVATGKQENDSWNTIEATLTVR